MAIPSKTVLVGGVTEASQYDALYNNAILANTGGTAGGAQSIPGAKTFQSATVFQATATIPNIAGAVAVSGQLEIAGASRVRAHQSTAQSIPTATKTTIIYNVEDYDNLSEYVHTTGVLTFLKAGYYSVKAAILFTAAAWTLGKTIWLKVYKNGTQYCVLQRTPTQALTGYFGGAGSTDIEIAAGDYIDIRVYHNQGAAVNLYNNAIYNYFSVHRLS